MSDACQTDFVLSDGDVEDALRDMRGACADSVYDADDGARRGARSFRVTGGGVSGHGERWQIKRPEEEVPEQIYSEFCDGDDVYVCTGDGLCICEWVCPVDDLYICESECTCNVYCPLDDDCPTDNVYICDPECPADEMNCGGECPADEVPSCGCEGVCGQDNVCVNDRYCSCDVNDPCGGDCWGNQEYSCPCEGNCPGDDVPCGCDVFGCSMCDSVCPLDGCSVCDNVCPGDHICSSCDDDCPHDNECVGDSCGGDHVCSGCDNHFYCRDDGLCTCEHVCPKDRT